MGNISEGQQRGIDKEGETWRTLDL